MDQRERSIWSSAVLFRVHPYKWRRGIRHANSRAYSCCDVRRSNRSEFLSTWKLLYVQDRNSLDALNVPNARYAPYRGGDFFQLTFILDLDGHFYDGAIAVTFLI